MKKNIVMTFITVSLLAGVSFLYFRNGDEVPVKVIRINRGEISATLNATGKVAGKENAEISPSVAGQVKAVYVREGDRVDQGALMALLDKREAGTEEKAAEQSLREAEEKVRQLERNYHALTDIYSSGGASKQSVDDAGSELKMAHAAVARATAKLSAGRIALEKLKIRAPFAGIVTRKEVNPGEWATPGTAIFFLSKENRREIEVMVDESDAGLVRTGQRVELTCDAFPGYAWTERIVHVAPAVRKEGTANSIKVRLSYGTKTPDLKLGQQVDARIRTASRSNVVRVPFDSIISTGGKTFVAVVRSGKITFIPVVTGIEDAVSIEIVKGIPDGEDVILPEGKPLKEGARARAVRGEPQRK